MLNDEEYKIAMDELSKAVGKPINYKTFPSFYDNLECMQYRGKEVPEVFSRPSQTKKAMDSLMALSYFVKFMGNN